MQRGNLPGEVAGGGHPFRPAWGYGGVPQNPGENTLKNPESYAKKWRPRGLSNVLFIRIQVTTVRITTLEIWRMITKLLHCFVIELKQYRDRDRRTSMAVAKVSALHGGAGKYFKKEKKGGGGH